VAKISGKIKCSLGSIISGYKINSALSRNKQVSLSVSFCELVTARTFTKDERQNVSDGLSSFGPEKINGGLSLAKEEEDSFSICSHGCKPCRSFDKHCFGKAGTCNRRNRTNAVTPANAEKEHC
jgi:hypothetical protein